MVWSRLVDRLRRLPAAAVDGGLAVVFLVAFALERPSHPPDRPGGTLLVVAMSLVISGCLALRRRLPMTAFLVGTAALCAESLLDVASPVSPYANQIQLYSLGLYATKTRARWAIPVVIVSVALYFAGTPASDDVEPIGVLFVWLATWALGYARARRREMQESLRLALRRQATAEERTRMARELHDVIGHTVNLMVVQAGAARMTLADEPATARDLLLGMEQTGREALVDLDRALGALRADTTPESGTVAREEALQPPPGLARLPELVDRLTDSGVAVSLSLDPDVRLPRSLDLTAYRIVQEALTNTMKYAAPCSANVVVRRDGGSVVLEVSDDGPGPDGRRAAGRGLLGIAERVSLHGGQLRHGGGERGGFTVRAVLPLP